MDIDTLITEAQKVVDSLTAFKASMQTPTTPATVTEVDVKESDGSEVITTPAETPAVEAAETATA